MDLSGIAVVDQHAHNLVRSDLIDRNAFLAAFTEASDPTIVASHVDKTLFFRRSLRDIAAVLECEPDLDSVLSARQRGGFEALVSRLFGASGVRAVLLDDGFIADRTLPISWHNRVVASHRLLRVEQLAERLVAETRHWAEFEDAFRTEVRNPPAEVVGLKSIVAYRTGLEVGLSDRSDAALRFCDLRSRHLAGEPIRLASKPINDWVVRATFEAAAATGMPVQLHTGFGDPDLDLRLANPLHLRLMLEDPQFRAVRVVLLHVYPFAREAGYLAAVYPNVYVDFGLAIPSLSVAGMRGLVRALIELSPLTKVLFSTDAHAIPELFYLGYKWGRVALGAELTAAVDTGDLTATEADWAAQRVLCDNARELYGV